MKQLRITFLLTLLLSMVGVKTFAYDVEVANEDGVTIYYDWTNDHTELSVTGVDSGTYSGDVMIPENVTYGGNRYSVTSIGDCAFYGCSGLTSVTIPTSVTTIGSYVFYSCSGLTLVAIPSSVTSIGDYAFSGCSDLTSITVNEGNSKYDSRNNCNAIVETATNKLIAGCKTSIIPNTVTSIGDGAFFGCSGLTSMTIPSSVTSIGSSAFKYCSGLTSVTIPFSVTSIRNYVFWECSGLTSLDIPSSVTSIGNNAFDGCSGLTSLDIPSSVTSIGVYAFSGCSGLTSVTIPSSVTTIVYGVFYGCSGLISVTIPSSVTSIGDRAFDGCSGLTSVTVGMETPLSIDSYTFSNRQNATLYVPLGSKTAYEAADYWKEFKNIIEMTAIVSGDANGDGGVNVTDYLAIANYILGVSTGDFNVDASDVNGDGEVNVSDYVGVANIILYGNYQGPSANAIMAFGAEAMSPWMEIALTDDGKINLLLRDTKPFSAFQMDISLPEGVEIADATMAKANQTKNLGYRRLQDGTCRLLYGTMDNKTVNMAGENLLKLELASSDSNSGGVVTIDHIFLADRNASAVQLDAVSSGLPTGIHAIESGTSMNGGYYDLTGRKVDNSQAKTGVYIVNGKKKLLK